ncbi:hypothetical protein [Streptacidiphilus sp. PAMC 29251]
MADRRIIRVYEDNGQPAPVASFGYGGPWGTFSLVRYVALHKSDSGRTHAELRVIGWYCGATLLDSKLVNRTVADIGRDLGLAPDSLTRMIRKLTKDRLLRKSGSIGRSPFYEITPYLVFNGSGYEHREALKGWNPPHIKGLTEEPEGYMLITDAAQDAAAVKPENFLSHIHSAALATRSA